MCACKMKLIKSLWYTQPCAGAAMVPACCTSREDSVGTKGKAGNWREHCATEDLFKGEIGCPNHFFVSKIEISILPSSKQIIFDRTRSCSQLGPWSTREMRLQKRYWHDQLQAWFLLSLMQTPVFSKMFHKQLNSHVYLREQLISLEIRNIWWC